MSKNIFFTKMRELGRWLTYDDVRLRTGYSECMPREVLLETKFSRNIPLKIPIVSAAMDTVTEHKMATGMALMGGLGIIHRGLSIKDQSREVSRVKFHLNGLIEKPICVNESETIESILKRREEKGWKFHTFPVVDNNGKLVGVLSGTDFSFCQNHSLTARDVMTTEVITSLVGTTIDEAYQLMCKNKKKVLPLVDGNGCVCGLYVFSDLHRIKIGDSKNSNLDARGQLRVGATIGTGEEALIRAENLIKANVDVLVMDTAHANSISSVETLKELKKRFTTTDIVVGNVSEKNAAERLIFAGADGIKVGQGPGSICTTRIIAGIGSPQVSAIYNCACAAEKYNIPVCADGGIKHTGDITIAIGAGAHNVMLGNLLAGTEESPGETIFFDGRQWKQYRGMGSLGAMQEYKSSQERYQQSESKNPLIPEGIEGAVPYRGLLRDVLFQYVGGLRQGMGYVGAKTILDLQKKADFILYTSAGQAESHPHDVKITKEAPNYQR